MTSNFTRRDFLKLSATAGLSFVAPTGYSIGYRPLLSFTTLGCPDWSFETILDFADEHGYDGIELRGILRQLDLTKCPEFSSRERIIASRKLVQTKKVKIIDLGSSAVLHNRVGAEREKNLDDARKFIQLAEQLGCPNIRLFPKDFPAGQERNETIDLIIKGLRELSDFAARSGVTVLLITYGSVVDSTATIEHILQGTGHPNVGIGWDVANMYFGTKEDPVSVYEKLKKYIRIIHVKDLKVVDGKTEGALMGKGDTPIFKTIDAMAKDGFNGYYSFEWEKYWHPEILEPEVALSDYARAMKRHFNM